MSWRSSRTTARTLVDQDPLTAAAGPAVGPAAGPAGRPSSVVQAPSTLPSAERWDTWRFGPDEGHHGGGGEGGDGGSGGGGVAAGCSEFAAQQENVKVGTSPNSMPSPVSTSSRQDMQASRRVGATRRRAARRTGIGLPSFPESRFANVGWRGRFRQRSPRAAPAPGSRRPSSRAPQRVPNMGHWNFFDFDPALDSVQSVPLKPQGCPPRADPEL